MPASRPLAVLLLATAAVALLLASSAGPAAAAVVSGKYGGGGRMVIIRHAPGAMVGGGGAAGTLADRWHYRRVEDDVAPEFGGMLATGQNHIGYRAINVPNRAACTTNCPGKGQAYTGRGCIYKNQCNGG